MPPFFVGLILDNICFKMKLFLLPWTQVSDKFSQADLEKSL